MTAILASTGKVTTMADGTLRITLDIEPGDAATAFTLFGQPGTSVAIARINNAAAAAHTASAIKAQTYGPHYQSLHKAGWFYSREVAAAFGTDEQYQEWCRHQPSAYSGRSDWYEELGEPRCVYAHVRRADISGTGYKPHFSGVPLTNAEHQRQHQHGESALDGFDMQKSAGEHLRQWLRKTIRAHFGVESMAEVDPHEFRSECERLGIGHTLPSGWPE